MDKSLYLSDEVLNSVRKSSKNLNEVEFLSREIKIPLDSEGNTITNKRTINSNLERVHEKNSVELSPEQEIIASSKEGKFLVSAGAGSGKTSTLVKRIERLVLAGVNPSEILAISFTRKASSTIKEKAIRLNSTLSDVHFGTFHSVCFQILRNDFGLTVNPEDIYLEEDVSSHLGDILNEEGVSYEKNFEENLKKFKKKVNYFQQIPNKNVPEEEKESIFWSLFQRYQRQKEEQGYIDLNDMLYKTYEQLEQNSLKSKGISKRFRYVIIDEAQDLNDIQFEITKYWYQYHENVMYIGDDYQSIYKFRGANVRNFIELNNNEDFKTLKMERNYRSTPNIIKASNRFISQNKEQLQKEAFSKKKNKYPIKLLRFAQAEDEAQVIVEEIKKDIKNGKNPNQIGVLFRTHKTVDLLEGLLNRFEIPNIHVGQEEIWYESRYKKLLYTTLDYLIYKKTSDFGKLLKNLKGIGPRTLEKLDMVANDNQMSIESLVFDFRNLLKINKKTSLSLENFQQEFHLLNELNEINSFKISDYFKVIHSFYLKMNHGKCLPKYLIFESLIETVKRFEDEKYLESNNTNLGTIFEYYKKNEAKYILVDENPNAIQLMTVHGSKGLEFEKIYIIGLNRGEFPDYRVDGEHLSPEDDPILINEELEEERRIMYVAMTRAGSELALSCSNGNPSTFWTFNQSLKDEKKSEFVVEDFVNPLSLLDIKNLKLKTRNSQKTIFFNPKVESKNQLLDALEHFLKECFSNNMFNVSLKKEGDWAIIATISQLATYQTSSLKFYHDGKFIIKKFPNVSKGILNTFDKAVLALLDNQNQNNQESLILPEWLETWLKNFKLKLLQKNILISSIIQKDYQLNLEIKKEEIHAHLQLFYNGKEFFTSGNFDSMSDLVLKEMIESILLDLKNTVNI